MARLGLVGSAEEPLSRRDYNLIIMPFDTQPLTAKQERKGRF